MDTVDTLISVLGIIAAAYLLYDALKDRRD